MVRVIDKVEPGGRKVLGATERDWGQRQTYIGKTSSSKG
jgi:hypothetical protein